jgi:hypothetical protein
MTMATIKVNLAEIGGAGSSDPTAPETRPPAGWSVFLCDDKGTLSGHAGKECGSVLVDHGCLEIKDVPPGRRLLFIRP